MIDISFSSLMPGVSLLLKTTAIVVGIFEGSNHLEDYNALVDQRENIMKIVEDYKSFDGKFAEVLPIVGLDKNYPVVIVVGLGKAEEFDEEKSLKIGGVIYSELNRMKISEASIISSSDSDIMANIAYGAFYVVLGLINILCKKR